MPPPNTPTQSQQANNRKRLASDRVVPAIPLALSKPKPTKPKPRPDADATAGSEAVRQEDASKALANGHAQDPSLTNGVEASVSAPEAVRIPDSVDPAARAPFVNTPDSRGSAPMSLSNGNTPELPTTIPPRPSTPPQAQPIQATTSPVSARKPTDRFDMRHIRTELPPAFIPSAEQHTPKSAASSQSTRAPSFIPHSHPAHPSSGSIVFGGQDSSTSSPIPPQSAGSAFATPPNAAFTGMPQPYFAPPSHAHHISEPHAQRPYYPGYPQQWNFRHGYGATMPQAPPFHPHAHMPPRYPPRDVFTPANSQFVNGRASRSRSPSQTSSDRQKGTPALQSPLGPEYGADTAKMMFQEPKVAFPGQPYQRQPPFNPPGPPPPQFAHPDATAAFENAEAMRIHIQSHFGYPAFSDFQLQISDEYNESEQNVDGHKVILSRSPSLLALIHNDRTMCSTEPVKPIQISLGGQYLRLETFIDALKYLYGGQLLQLDHQRPVSSSNGHVPTNVERMETALQTIASGAWLQVPAIAGRGVEVAGGLLHWDTITNALAFALAGGLSHIWTVDDGSEDRASSSSSDDSLGRSETISAPTHDPYATHLLQRIVDFTVHVFPHNFYLDAAAPQLASSPRLPSLPLGHESKASRSDPRLSQIRFGEIPVEDHQRPSFATTIVSSVLLSLPFSILKCVLEHFDLSARLGPETVASVMRQVVAEREMRRNKGLKARVANQVDESIETQLVQNLLWEEFVEPSAQHRAGFRLARRRREIDTPPSSGACSERNK